MTSSTTNDKWILVWTMRPDHTNHTDCDYCEAWKQDKDNGAYFTGDDADLWIDDFELFDTEDKAKNAYERGMAKDGYNLWRIAYAKMIESDNFYGG